MGTETARQRRIARTILVLIASAVTFFVLFASGPTMGFVIAQQTTSSPTPTYTIEFLNPSGENFSKSISDKEDSDERYHLVAWVNQLPPSPTVEFRYRNSAGNEVTIATATQTGIPDTFEHFWQIPAEIPEEEDVTLFAVLFSGGTEVDRDTSTQTVNRDDPDENDPTDMSSFALETVEINYPLNGGAWGLFTPRSKPTAGILRVTLSSDAPWVRAVYTVTPPGQEPQWTTCGTERRAAAADGLRCTLANQHRGTDVRAVGAVANFSGGTYNASNDESADAHRVEHYEQVPTNVTLEPANQDSVQTGACSATITATLTDQQGVELPGANLDVHAQGPSDELKFDSNNSAAPTLGGHTSESAWNCSPPNTPTGQPGTPGPAGSQGDHNLPENDIKHVETPAAGTTDQGKWTFRLRSPDIGTTQFTVFSDLDDDDVFCSAEVSANGAVGWGQTSGGITGVPSQTSSCPSPSPTSPNPGPTTPTPDPSGSPSPDPRGCTVTGTDGSEQLVGTPGEDIICAYDGNDIIKGLGGDDIIFGDEGRDDIRGGRGSDVIEGGPDEDTIRGNAGKDDVLAGGQNDVVTGGTGNDLIVGEHGVDTLRGSAGRDRLGGGKAGDHITGGKGRDYLKGNEGRDTLIGGRDRDRCIGGPDRDTLKSCERGRT